MHQLPVVLRSRRFFLRTIAVLFAGSRVAAASWKTVVKKRVAPLQSAVPPIAGDFPGVLASALRGESWQPSDAILVEIPQNAENGAIVPITVESQLPDTRRILILAEKNPGPLLAELRFNLNADPWVALRVRLNETGPVLIIAEAGGRFYGRQVQVQVMVGGCG